MDLKELLEQVNAPKKETKLNLKELLNQVNEENTELDIQTAEKVLEEEGFDIDYEFEPLKEDTIKSGYAKYPVIKNYDYVVIKSSHLISYLEDIVDELIQTLPDGFERYFNGKQLAKDMLDDFVKVYQTQKYLEEKDIDTEIFDKIHPTNEDCYILEYGV